MLEVGFETKSLILLAWETEPFNQFEMQELTTKVLDELNLDYSHKETIIKNYIWYEIDRFIKEWIDVISILYNLKELYIETDDDYLYYFYLLYFAKTDLLESEVQWYIIWVDRSNIDKKILEYFISFNYNE